MLFEELSEFFGETKIVKLIPNCPDFNLKSKSYIRINGVGNNYVISSVDEPTRRCIIKPLDEAEKNKLDALISKQYIAQIIQYKDNLEIHGITYNKYETADFSIFISEKILERGQTTTRFKERFKREYYLECGDKKYCIIGRHKNARDGELGFVFCRNGYSIPIKSKRKSNFSAEEQTYIDEVKDDHDDSDFTILYAEKERPSRDTNSYIYTLVEANIMFCDTLKNMAFATEALTFAKAEGIGEFLERWSKYNEEENEKWEKAQIDAGSLNYISRKESGNNYELEFDKTDFTKRKIDNFIQVMNETRNYSVEISVTKNGEIKDLVFDVVQSVLKREKRFIIKPLHDDYPPIPGKDTIKYSIAGYKNQYNNRKAVFELILENECKMQQLPMLLSGKTSKFSANNISHHEAITDRILEDVFEGLPPNEMQRKAVEVAINTPDWAIIQGPPGTGKTTVISAIAQRLNDQDVAKKTNFGFADSLMTAYQNDATENMTKKVEIHGLPTPKIDNKKESRIMALSVQEWIEKKKNKLNEKYSGIKKNLLYDKIRKILLDYNIKSATYEKNINILELLKTQYQDIIDNKLLIMTEILQKEAIREKEKRLEENNLDIFLSSKLPSRKESFDDNGMNLFYEIKLALSNKNVDDYLQEIGNMYSSSNIDFEKIKQIKNKLICSLLPRNEELIPSTGFNTKVYDLLASIQSENNINLDQEEIILSDYVRAFNESQIEVFDSIIKFFTIVGATHQFSASSSLASIKAELKAQEGYDTVFFDEAARSTPLDMLIPMISAKDRLIVVGDHRQLPPMLDDELIKKLEGNKVSTSYAEERSGEYYKTMFEHMIEVSEKLYETDHFNRVVQLDTQYRMHPTLGDFISKYFYENVEHGFKLKSGRPASDFIHNLPGIENKCMVWIDIPYTDAHKEEHTTSKSWQREIEAKCIATHIKMLMDSEGAADLNFGIISFYLAQVDMIKKELLSLGVYKKKNNDFSYDDEYVLTEKYSKTRNGKEKLRVGTVDSFQGLEFDVVYLSMVRSNDRHASPKDYGHLISDERLCVSLSRQKKCLIIAGDSKMVQEDNEIAKKHVPALVGFYGMCSKGDNEYGTIKYITDFDFN